MSDESDGFGEPRALALVVRRGDGGYQLLVFDHPLAGTQIPKGRIEAEEPAAEAAHRELLEESGLSIVPDRHLGTAVREFPHPTTGETIVEDWHCYLFLAPLHLPDRWDHHADEEGITFGYRWIPLSGAHLEVHEHFTDILLEIEQMFGSDLDAR